MVSESLMRRLHKTGEACFKDADRVDLAKNKILKKSGAQPIDRGLLIDRGLFPSRPRGLLEKILKKCVCSGCLINRLLSS